MPWLQLTITTDQTNALSVENLFENLGALSITYKDAADLPILELAPEEIKIWQLSLITGLFSEQIDLDIVQSILQANLPQNVFATLTWKKLEDKIWEREWLQNAVPLCFGKRLWVCPAGHYPSKEDIGTEAPTILELDPGLAFGTGTHPTTALCLNWLAMADLQNKHVLDYGCGSGILAIAAALLGATAVTAVDYDPQALEATIANVDKNNVDDKISVLSSTKHSVAIKYDYVVANILAKTLRELAPKLISLVRPGGCLILSGILKEQVTEVIEMYQPYFSWNPVQQNQEWILIAGIRRDIKSC